MSYLPGRRSGTVYEPVASVATARATPVATLVSVILTFGIAACEASITVPDRTPPDTCAFRPTQRTLENASRPATRKTMQAPLLSLGGESQGREARARQGEA